MSEPLTLWTSGATRNAILELVDKVTAQDTEGFVPPAERIATFDNDGTLWCEKPFAQGAFVAERLVSMAKADPSLRDRQPWKAIAGGHSSWIDDALTKHYGGDDTDMAAFYTGIGAAFGDISVEEFESQASAFFATALHPTFGQPYQNLGFLPMVQLLRFLEANDFTCYIVSGGGRDVVRPITQSMYGIPPERVIGSSSGLKFEAGDDGVNIVRTEAVGIIDDGPEKAIQIWERIGRRPILAAGNTNGDVPMLQFAADQTQPTLCMLVHHDDAEREVAYDLGAERALSTAASEGWTVISMKSDWTQVFEHPIDAHSG